MALDRTSLSIYLDELDNDPIVACDIARSLGLSSVCLRKVWSTGIGRTTDAACKQLMTALRTNKLSVLAVCTDDGHLPADNLLIDKAVRRSLVVAAYFKAKFFRPFVGLRPLLVEGAIDAVDAWMTTLSVECGRAAVTPLVEIDPDAYAFEPADVAALLEKHPTWRLLYDPSLLVIKRNQDPLVRYWYLLRGRIGAFDLHDFKIGTGFVPIGTGNCRIEDTLRDCLTTNYAGAFIIEPGATRRTGIITPKPELVKAAIANYIQMIVRGRAAIAAWSGRSSNNEIGQAQRARSGKQAEIKHGEKRPRPI